jgi:glutamate dehydrogenase
MNDALRINGVEVRAKVIAEGANLGVTQLGRIEYAKNGGRINTDALDNSAGVDCSDHEVNIKILLNQVMLKNDLTFEKRNTLLHTMTDEVARLVLKDNFWQSQAISLARSQGVRLLDEQARLMRDLEEEEILNRALENLPDDTEIVRRMADKQGLTRPELAVLLAYAKMSLTQEILHSNVPDLTILSDGLISYFPGPLQKAYRCEIETHPLRREIAATLLTNSIVNRMGITFVNEMKRQGGASGSEVARAYLIVKELLDLAPLWQELEAIEILPTSFQTGLMLTLYETVKRFTDWFLRFGDIHCDIETLLHTFKPDFDILKKELRGLFPPQQRQLYQEKCREYEHLGLSSSLAEKFLALDPLVAAPDMITLSQQLSLNITMIARVYFALGQQLGFEWLRKTALGLSGETHWQQGAANVFIEDLYMNQRAITKKILTSGNPLDQLLKEDGSLAKDILSTTAVESTLFDLMNASTVDFAMLTVMSRQLHRMV